MAFHKVAIDVISKGLDPRHPHKELGNDGMLAVPQKEQPSVVVSVSGSDVSPQKPTEKEHSVEQSQQTTEPVVAKTVRRPPGRTPKVTPPTPQDGGSSS